MKNHGIIFDMDGVIVDSNRFHRVSLKQFCEKHGFQLTEDDLVTRIFGRTNKDWITNVFGPLPAEKIIELTEEKEGMYRALHEPGIVPLAGLPEFLLKLKEQNYPIAVATSAPMSNVEFILGKTQLRDFFPIILKDTDITEGKPDPGIYLKAAASLGLSAENCVVFEDSLSGIAAGKAAGAKVVGVTTTHAPAELAYADYIITDFTGLDPTALVDELFPGK